MQETVRPKQTRSGVFSGHSIQGAQYTSGWHITLAMANGAARKEYWVADGTKLRLRTSPTDNSLSIGGEARLSIEEELCILSAIDLWRTSE